MRQINQGLLATALVVLAGILWLGMPVQQTHAHPDSGCSSCHVPHNATGDNSEVPLWNPARVSTIIEDSYSSSSLDASITQINGASLLCLSCHDGTVTSVGSKPSPNKGFTAGNMGLLENSHPVSFVYDEALAAADGALVDPSTLPRGVLDGKGQVQCTSCHEVHKTPTRQEVSNLRWAYVKTGGPSTNTTAAFCRNCHIK